MIALTFLVFEFYQRHFVSQSRAMVLIWMMADCLSMWLDYFDLHVNLPFVTY